VKDLLKGAPSWTKPVVWLGVIVSAFFILFYVLGTGLKALSTFGRSLFTDPSALDNEVAARKKAVTLNTCKKCYARSADWLFRVFGNPTEKAEFNAECAPVIDACGSQGFKIEAVE